MKRLRKASGAARPRYLDHQDVDKIFDIVLALASEVAALRERLDSHERVADLGQLPSTNAIEDYRPDATVESNRTVWRDGYIRRLFRIISESIPSPKDDGPE